MTVTENRRRPKRAAKDQDVGVIPVATSGNGELRKRKQRTFGYFLRKFLRRSRRAPWHSPRNLPMMALLILLSTVTILLLKHIFLQSAKGEPVLVGTSRDFSNRYYDSRKVVKRNLELYDEVYKLKEERRKPPDLTEWPEYERRPYQLGPTYGPSITECSVTIVFMDPRFGFPVYNYGPGQAAWFALESIGAFAPEACVLLQTSSCEMKEYFGDSVEGEEEVVNEVYKVIYDNSLPLFRRMIENGNVRVTFLDSTKYNLKSCGDFTQPSPAFMNRFYWKDEFIDGIDSEQVVVFQDDVALCYRLEIEEWKDYAYVGGAWPKTATPLTPEPFEGACIGMANRWKDWLLPQRRWEMQQRKGTALNGKKALPKPIEMLPTDYPPICVDGMGPIGNGGFSIRSRDWMIKAIETCPHAKYSGIDLTDLPIACKVFEAINEDFYFGTVLSGIGAPLPLAYDASLFSTEMLWPEQVWDLYGTGGNAQSDLRGAMSTGRPYTFMDDGTKLTIPNGVHKPWWYHPNEMLRSDSMTKACPFLQYLFNPSMSRWEELQPKEKWVGVGK